jgi:hypothetical protein
MQWPPLPDFGIIPRWPVDGQDFIHPDDVAVAVRCFPSERVLRRESFDGTYYHYTYGNARFRLTPVMWLKVDHEGIDIGDQVETIGSGLERELFVATVWGMHYVQRKGCIVYRLRRGDQIVPRLYTQNQLKQLTDKNTVREANFEYPAPQWKGDQSDREAFEP